MKKLISLLVFCLPVFADGPRPPGDTTMQPWSYWGTQGGSITGDNGTTATLHVGLSLNVDHPGVTSPINLLVKVHVLQDGQETEQVFQYTFSLNYNQTLDRSSGSGSTDCSVAMPGGWQYYQEVYLTNGLLDPQYQFSTDVTYVPG